jgi:DNA-binding response OmpR family regulator
MIEPEIHYPSTPTPVENTNNKKGKLSGVSILWVEDDKLIGKILLKKLEDAGAEVSLAKNGEEALKAVGEKVPKIIILDVLLPGDSGFDILQKMRAISELKDTPVMMLSNMSRDSDIEKSKMYNVKKYLVKASVSLDQIVNEIADIVKS